MIAPTSPSGESGDAPPSRRSSFSLSEAMDDIKILESYDGQAHVKPVDAIREMLLKLDIPNADRLEILKNLQMRDNWLLFLAKHFRKVLQSVQKEQSTFDTRVRCLQDVFDHISFAGQSTLNKSQWSTTTESSPPSLPHIEIIRPLSPVEESTGLCGESSGTSMTSPPPSTFFEAQKQAGAAPPFPATRGSESSSSSSCHRREVHIIDDPSVALQRAMFHKIGTDVSPGLRAPLETTRPRREVGQVVNAYRRPSRNTFCISLVASALGNQPRISSGLIHFSPSCEWRAALPKLSNITPTAATSG